MHVWPGLGPGGANNPPWRADGALRPVCAEQAGASQPHVGRAEVTFIAGAAPSFSFYYFCGLHRTYMKKKSVRVESTQRCCV